MAQLLLWTNNNSLISLLFVWCWLTPAQLEEKSWFSSGLLWHCVLFIKSLQQDTHAVQSEACDLANTVPQLCIQTTEPDEIMIRYHQTVTQRPHYLCTPLHTPDQSDYWNSLIFCITACFTTLHFIQTGSVYSCTQSVTSVHNLPLHTLCTWM